MDHIPAAASLFAIVMAIGAAAGKVWLKPKTLADITTDSLESLLGVMVSVFGAEAGGTSPRALELLMGDDSTRLAIASFIVAFIYSIIAKTALDLSYQGETGASSRFYAPCWRWLT